MKPKRGEVIVGFIPAFILIAIVFTTGIAGFLYTKELERNEYFTDLKAESDNEFATMKQQNRNKNISEIDISDWKTYRNEKYGFELKYPPEWPVWEVEIKESISQSIGKTTSINLLNRTHRITITINAPAIGFEDEPWELIEDSEKIVSDVSFGKKIIRDKEKGVYWVQMNITPYAPSGSVSSLKQNYLIITDAVNERGLLNDYDQILSTFKFI